MYLFLLGRNQDLSILELFNYLDINKIKYSVFKRNTQYVILNIVNKNLDFKKIIQELGGIKRIVNIFKTVNELNSKFINYLPFEYGKKFNFAVSTINVSNDDTEYIINVLKEDFKSSRTKAVYKKPRKHYKIRETVINPNNYFSWKLDNGFELFVVNDNNNYYFGNTVACYNSKNDIFLDKHRPVKKFLHSTSFRLVRIMINLLGLKKNKTLLDPFCGTGSFLIQGLLLGYNVIGSDKSSEMYDISKRNVSWAVKEFKLKNTYKVINTDSSKTIIKSDAVVFEPYMGPFLNKIPNDFRAKKLVNSLTKLYFNLFKQLTNSLKSKSKVVCILPEFKTYEKNLYKINHNVFFKNNFILVDLSKYNIKNPISYSSPSGSKINRYIYILEKK